ncbi:hypothetical protein V7S57_02345 [Caulobacter sp. CCNWLY153]|uniref:hypothetical protein n=1 Tax=unclassified Caulobacter TaxID=2648921 RepID=UPI002FF04AE9
MAATWKVEDFLKGRSLSGEAPTLVKAREAARKVVDGLGRQDLRGVLATVTSGKKLWNLKATASSLRGRFAYDWEEVAPCT